MTTASSLSYFPCETPDETRMELGPPVPASRRARVEYMFVLTTVLEPVVVVTLKGKVVRVLAR